MLEQCSLENILHQEILITAQNHQTGEITPFAFYSHGELYPGELIERVFSDDFDPESFYKTSVPKLEEIPPAFTGFFEDHETHLQRIRKAYPDLAGHNEINNPSSVAVTTVPMDIPSRLFYTDEPNSTFAITAGLGAGQVDKTLQQSIERAAKQLHYSISHALESEGHPDVPFSRLYEGGVLIVEGTSPEQVDLLQRVVFERPEVDDWRRSSRNRVFTVESQQGRVVNVEEVPQPRPTQILPH